MTKKDYTELFLLRLRGGIASAFTHSGAQISDEHWKMLRGEQEITMRDLGEIGHLTGYIPELQFTSTEITND